MMRYTQSRGLAGAAFLISLVALIVSIIGWTRPFTATQADPPIVLRGVGVLHCSISSTANGSQELSLLGGSGPMLKVALKPITDGKVTLGADGSAEYAFSSFLVAATPMTIVGIDEGTLETLSVEAKVRVSRIVQPEGPGTKFTFGGDALLSQQQYIEILGTFVTKDATKYSLRISLQDITDGGGTVVPSSAGQTATLLSKEVQLGSEAKPATIITTLIELK